MNTEHCGSLDFRLFVFLFSHMTKLLSNKNVYEKPYQNDFINLINLIINKNVYEKPYQNDFINLINLIIYSTIELNVRKYYYYVLK